MSSGNKSLEALISRTSLIEMDARERVHALLDHGSFEELLDPFEQLASPWLPLQEIVPQADDGVVIARGKLAGTPTVIAAIEGAFQGGSLGEVSGAKIAGALELAAEDNQAGTPTHAVLLLETGGVRLQEANLGLAAIAEIHAAIVELRRHVPVVGAIVGQVGCFGGMSIAAGLCSHLVMTREGRLGLNGPQVIEQEAGLAEFDSRDRPFIWDLLGGRQRYRSGMADDLIDDDLDALREVLTKRFQGGLPEPEPERARSERIEAFERALAAVDWQHPPDGEAVRRIYGDRETTAMAGGTQR